MSMGTVAMVAVKITTLGNIQAEESITLLRGEARALRIYNWPQYLFKIYFFFFLNAPPVSCAKNEIRSTSSTVVVGVTFYSLDFPF